MQGEKNLICVITERGLLNSRVSCVFPNSVREWLLSTKKLRPRKSSTTQYH